MVEKFKKGFNMLIERTCPFTDNSNALYLPITKEEYNDWVLGIKTAEQAFSRLPKDMLLFITDGILPEDSPDKFERW